MPVGGFRTLSATTRNDGTTLIVKDEYQVRASQGTSTIIVNHRYALSEKGNLLTYTMERSSRQTGPQVTFTLKRPGYKEAFVIRLEDN